MPRPRLRQHLPPLSPLQSCRLPSRFLRRDYHLSDRVGVVFLLCAALAVGISHLRPKPQAGAVELGDVSFATSGSFNLSALLVTLILCAFYITWW